MANSETLNPLLSSFELLVEDPYSASHIPEFAAMAEHMVMLPKASTLDYSLRSTYGDFAGLEN